VKNEKGSVRGGERLEERGVPSCGKYEGSEEGGQWGRKKQIDADFREREKNKKWEAKYRGEGFNRESRELKTTGGSKLQKLFFGLGQERSAK